MRRTALAPLLALPLALAAGLCAPALAGDRHSVVIDNRDGATIREVHIVPTGSPGWGANRLVSTLPSGVRAPFQYSGACQANLRIVLADGRAEERRDVDVCASPTIAVAPGWATAGLSNASAEAAEAGPGPAASKGATAADRAGTADAGIAAAAVEAGQAQAGRSPTPHANASASPVKLSHAASQPLQGAAVLVAPRPDPPNIDGPFIRSLTKHYGGL